MQKALARRANKPYRSCRSCRRVSHSPASFISSLRSIPGRLLAPADDSRVRHPRGAVMATYVVLPPRELLEHAIQEFLETLFPTLPVPAGLWERVLDEVAGEGTGV